MTMVVVVKDNRKAEELTHEEMITEVIRKYRFEHEATIQICQLVEIAEERNNHWMAEAFLRGAFEGIMRQTE